MSRDSRQPEQINLVPQTRTLDEMSRNSRQPERINLESLKPPIRNLFKVKRKWKKRILKFVPTAFVLLMLAGIVYLLVDKFSNKTDKKDQTSPTASLLIGRDTQNIRAREIAHKGMIGVRYDPLLQDCLEYNFKKSFPNIGYALLGYDIYNGFPLADSHDPGFTKPIFKADYSEKRQTADCRYSVPNGIFVIPDVSCETSFSSKVIENEKQLQKSFSMAADLSVGIKAFPFQSSYGYKEMSSSLTKDSSVYVLSSAHCNYYFVKILQEKTPAFDDIFLVWMYKLQTDSNTTYIEFMNTFGTHFITEATFGARYTNEYKMKSTYYESTKGSQYSVSLRASFSGKIDIGGGFSLDSEQRTKASEFNKNVETRTITVGAAPPADGDAMTWASTVQENPIPTRYVLEPIENIFVDEYVGDLGIDFEMIRSNIIRYKEDFKIYREQNSRLVPGRIPDNEIVTWHIKETIYVEGGGLLGRWGESERCPPGQFAIGYNLKIEAYMDGDNTALNAVKLICADINGEITKKEITSTQAMWGYYRKENAECSRSRETPYFLTRFSLQMDDNRGIAATFVNFTCRDLEHTKEEIPLALFPGHGEPFGDRWYTSGSCPKGTAICGIKTKVQGKQDRGDDSALNDVKFYCCSMNKIST